jgi:isopentenyl diphosphate isomerase/L-lactate dehydrogenase-like FMN-dependent dehydrogenase
MVLKGVMSAADARLALEHGVDGVVVSNHGGRQLDGLPATIDVLPEVVDAVGRRVEVLFDGGISRGTHVVKALALGARACLIGKAFLYGLAAQGETGVLRALTILNDEIRRALSLLGCARVTDLDRTFVRLDLSHEAPALPSTVDTARAIT